MVNTEGAITINFLGAAIQERLYADRFRAISGGSSTCSTLPDTAGSSSPTPHPVHVVRARSWNVRTQASGACSQSPSPPGGLREARRRKRSSNHPVRCRGAIGGFDQARTDRRHIDVTRLDPAQLRMGRCTPSRGLLRTVGDQAGVARTASTTDAASMPRASAIARNSTKSIRLPPPSIAAMTD